MKAKFGLKTCNGHIFNNNLKSKIFMNIKAIALFAFLLSTHITFAVEETLSSRNKGTIDQQISKMKQAAIKGQLISK